MPANGIFIFTTVYSTAFYFYNSLFYLNLFYSSLFCNSLFTTVFSPDETIAIAKKNLMTLIKGTKTNALKRLNRRGWRLGKFRRCVPMTAV
jgi:hypothetical protein